MPHYTLRSKGGGGHIYQQLVTGYDTRDSAGPARHIAPPQPAFPFPIEAPRGQAANLEEEIRCRRRGLATTSHVGTVPRRHFFAARRCAGTLVVVSAPASSPRLEKNKCAHFSSLTEDAGPAWRGGGALGASWFVLLSLLCTRTEFTVSSTPFLPWRVWEHHTTTRGGRRRSSRSQLNPCCPSPTSRHRHRRHCCPNCCHSHSHCCPHRRPLPRASCCWVPP